MAVKKGGKTWLLYGCFGCLGVAAFLIMIVVGFVGIAFMQMGPEDLQQETITPVLPSQAILPGSLEFVPGRPAAAGLELQEPQAVVDGNPAGGRVILDAQHGGFEIEPGEPGEPLRLEASYDRNAYDLEEILEAGEDGSWVYRINFRRKAGSGFLGAIQQLIWGDSPSVKVVLPVDVPLDLEVRASQGGLKMELGGLWLRTAEIHFSQGGFLMSVSRPLREPMERLSITGSMGGFATARLGNASPRILDINFSMGGGVLGLRGAWRNDSRVSISSSMGGGRVLLPMDVAIEGIELSKPRPKSTLELPLPTLIFTMSGSSLDNLEFDD